MKIAFIQTYPVYYDLQLSTEQWLRVENRDKWMPAILAAEGYEVELWGVAQQSSDHRYEREGIGEFPLKLFRVTKTHKRSKHDFSEDLTEYARSFDPDLLILKGIDGGAGIHLLEQYILPRNKPFIFVIGGKFYNKYAPRAAGMFYETLEQKNKLTKPGWHVDRRKIPDEKLVQLPKSVDTVLFSPAPDVKKEFDLVSAGRLIPTYKNYDALGRLSAHLKVALVGDGPLRESLQKRFPKLRLIGSLPHRQIPAILNRGSVFFYPGLKDFFPRVIPEAMAVGLPCVGFEEAITKEVIPEGCGLRVPTEHYVPVVRNLLQDKKTLVQYGKNARRHVLDHWGICSTRDPMLYMLDQLNIQP